MNSVLLLFQHLRCFVVCFPLWDKHNHAKLLISEFFKNMKTIHNFILTLALLIAPGMWYVLMNINKYCNMKNVY